MLTLLKIGYLILILCLFSNLMVIALSTLINAVRNGATKENLFITLELPFVPANCTVGYLFNYLFQMWFASHLFVCIMKCISLIMLVGATTITLLDIQKDMTEEIGIKVQNLKAVDGKLTDEEYYTWQKSMINIECDIKK